MGYIINGKGNKIKVNDSDGYCAENVILINDDTVLVDKYLLNIVKCNLYNEKLEDEFVAEILFDKESTQEEIIFHMVKNGVNRYTGYAMIDKIKVLDFKESEE